LRQSPWRTEWLLAPIAKGSERCHVEPFDIHFSARFDGRFSGRPSGALRLCGPGAFRALQFLRLSNDPAYLNLVANVVGQIRTRVTPELIRGGFRPAFRSGCGDDVG
jgi:hypothetical protein